MPIVSRGQISGVTEGAADRTTGTYEVNADCTGKVILTLTLPSGTRRIEARFVIVNRGLEIIEVPTTAGNVGAAVLRRQ